jgi:hypothetical protein
VPAPRSGRTDELLAASLVRVDASAKPETKDHIDNEPQPEASQDSTLEALDVLHGSAAFTELEFW